MGFISREVEADAVATPRLRSQSVKLSARPLQLHANRMSRGHSATRLSALGCRVGRHSNVIAPARPKITKESVGLGPEPREETGSSPTSLTPRSLTPRPHRATDGLWRTARAHRGPRMSRGRLGFASSTIVYGYKYAHVLTILENLGVQFVASQVPHPASRSIGDRTCVGRVDVESVVVRGRRERVGSRPSRIGAYVGGAGRLCAGAGAGALYVRAAFGGLLVEQRGSALVALIEGVAESSDNKLRHAEFEAEATRSARYGVAHDVKSG